MKIEEAVERGNTGQAVTGKTPLPDRMLMRLPKGLAGVAESFVFKMIIGVGREAGIKIPLVRADGAQPARSTRE
jgi:hypothetical protein